MSKELPKVKFPLEVDDDYSLFVTHNSAQTTLTRDLSNESEVIEIAPRSANESEVWADNGFITIEKEIVYYDSVAKNSSGKIVQFKNCIREVEGKAESYQAGTPVYANVVAQLHNQLVDAVLAIENTIGDISDMLKVGTELKEGKKTKKPLVGDVDHAFTASLNDSLTAMMGMSAVNDDFCPDVEFEINNIGGIAEYCVRIYGSYTSVTVDFGDGFTTQQLQGTHTYLGSGPYNPTVTVMTPTCTLVQMPGASSDCSTPPLPNPSIPFVVQIPLVPNFPSFIPPKMVCPGPLFNLPPIIVPGNNLCPSQIFTCPSFTCPAPSVIISVIEACKTPQIIKVVSPCRISIISLVGCEMPSIISLVGCCPPSVISIISPSFSTISFATPPSFNCISFCAVPSFSPISFNAPPMFAPVSFAPFPSIGQVSFDILVDLSVSPICFCTPPSFAAISFAPPPNISVIWGIPPTVSCVVSVQCPSNSCTTSEPSFMGFGMTPPKEEEGIPVTFGDLGLPHEIAVIVPKIPDIKVIHDLPKSIELKSDIPRKIFLDTSDMPRTVFLEPAPNLPSFIQVIGMPATLPVTGIPKTIEIIENIPRTIQLLMPEDPIVTMKWDGVPVEMKPSPDWEKMFNNLMVQPK